MPMTTQSIQSDGTAVPGATPRVNRRPAMRAALSEYAVLLAAIAYFLLALPFVPALSSPANLSNLFGNMLPLLVLALGQTIVLITAGIDLSMVAVVGLCSVLGAWVMTDTPHLGLLAGHPAAVAAGMAAMVAAGAAVGLLNGLAVTLLRVPPFIVTLATMMVAGGAAVWGATEVKRAAAARAAEAVAAGGRRTTAISADPSIGNLPEPFAAIGYDTALGLPIALWVAGAVAIAAHVMLARTLPGRRLYAVGLNERAAAVSGVRVRATVAAAYALSGLCAGVAAVLYTARLETGKPDLLGRDALLDVIGAAVIGGTSLFGGKGKVLWTVFGVLLFTLISNSLNLLGLQDDKIMVAKGCVILAAAGLDMLRNRLSAPG